LISSLNKPNGQTFIFPEDIEKYTAKLKLNDINGFGPVNGEKLQKDFKIETAGQLLGRFSRIFFINHGGLPLEGDTYLKTLDRYFTAKSSRSWLYSKSSY